MDVHLSRSDMEIVYRHAKAACIGGSSHVRGSDRQERLLEDQIAGLAGNMALAIWRDGDHRAYLESRHSQNRMPTTGDGGFDLPRCRLDVKTSVMRAGCNPSRYRLAVRPKERHHGWLYALALIKPFEIKDLALGLTVNLVGWAEESSLPGIPESSGVFTGAFTLPAKDLIPFPPMTYES